LNEYQPSALLYCVAEVRKGADHLLDDHRKVPLSQSRLASRHGRDGEISPKWPCRVSNAIMLSAQSNPPFVG